MMVPTPEPTPSADGTDHARAVGVVSRVVIAMSTGDIEVLTLDDGAILVNGKRVEPVPSVSQSKVVGLV
jgi:hypothetical protein